MEISQSLYLHAYVIRYLISMSNSIALTLQNCNTVLIVSLICIHNSVIQQQYLRSKYYETVLLFENLFIIFRIVKLIVELVR